MKIKYSRTTDLLFVTFNFFRAGPTTTPRNDQSVSLTDCTSLIIHCCSSIFCRRGEPFTAKAKKNTATAENFALSVCT